MWRGHRKMLGRRAGGGIARSLGAFETGEGGGGRRG
jgi:hypothetical protein